MLRRTKRCWSHIPLDDLALAAVQSRGGAMLACGIACYILVVPLGPPSLGISIAGHHSTTGVDLSRVIR